MIKRFLPVMAVLLAIGAVYYFDLHTMLNLQSLQENREWLNAQVANNALITGSIFVAVYAICVALSIPGALILTLAGGFMFGTWLGGCLVVIGATIGASTIFLVARSALGNSLRQKAGPWLEKVEKGFREDGLSYLLVLRLVPIFPFWLVNLVPAFLGVSFGMFTLTTFLGIMPGSFVYASVGNGLGEIFKSGGAPDLSIITNPAVLGPLLGLALLACVPMAYKRWRRSEDQSS